MVMFCCWWNLVLMIYDFDVCDGKDDFQEPNCNRTNWAAALCLMLMDISLIEFKREESNGFNMKIKWRIKRITTTTKWEKEKWIFFFLLFVFFFFHLRLHLTYFSFVIVFCSVFLLIFVFEFEFLFRINSVNRL